MSFVITFTLLSILRIMSSCLNFLLSIKFYIEVHMCALKSESNTQLEIEETIRLVSIMSMPSQGISSFFFRLSRIKCLEPFKVLSTVTSMLINSGKLQSNLFIWQFTINYPNKLIRDWRIKSTFNSLYIFSLSFSSSSRSLIIVIQ